MNEENLKLLLAQIDKEIKGEVYNLNDEPVCESCFNDAIDRAEMAYESQREDGLNL